MFSVVLFWEPEEFLAYLSRTVHSAAMQLGGVGEMTMFVIDGFEKAVSTQAQC